MTNPPQPPSTPIESILDELVYQCTGKRVLPSRHTEGSLPKEEFNNAAQALQDYVNSEVCRWIENHRGDAIGGGKAAIVMSFEEVEKELNALKKGIDNE